MKDRKKLGSIWVDTATILVGDPCQLLADGERSKVPVYADLLRRIFPSRSPAEEARAHELLSRPEELSVAELTELNELTRMPPPNRVVLLPNRSGEGIAAISILTGSDGFYPVYLEYDAEDNAARLVIELGGKVEP